VHGTPQVDLDLTYEQVFGQAPSPEIQVELPGGCAASLFVGATNGVGPRVVIRPVRSPSDCDSALSAAGMVIGSSEVCGRKPRVAE
jgi:hypothetical protein